MIDIQDLKDDISIEEVLEHYGWVDDTHGGGWQEWKKTLCPFHDDQTPSATVNMLEGRFHCFTCDTSGDIIDIVMIEEHLTFKEAVRFLRETFLGSA